MRLRRGRGFTVVEVMVAMVIFALILGGMWALYISARKQAHKADVRLQGIKSSLFLLEPLERDFSRVFIDHKHTIDINPEGRMGIEFSVFDLKTSNLDRGQIFTKRVAYLFSPNDRAVYRRESNGKPKRIPGIFERLVFRLRDTPDYLKMPPYKDKLKGKPDFGGLVTYLVTCVPIEFINVPIERWKPQDRTTITGSLFPRVPLGRRKHHFWSFNHTSVPRN